jgi:uncharacterized membrane protein (UPF0127 family)
LLKNKMAMISPRNRAQLLNLTDEEENLLFFPLFYAGSFWRRFRGLMFCPPKKGYGLILVPCNSIHTFFMRFSLDVFFLDEMGRVLDIRWNLAPWRMAVCRGARMVVECPTGHIPHEKVSIGSRLTFH